MAKFEVIIKSEIVRLAKREMRKIAVPLGSDVRSLKSAVSQLRKAVFALQKELAILTGVTVGAIHQWESGQFKPSMKKKAVMVALRKLGRREVRKLLEGKETPMAKKRIPSRRRKRIKRVRRK
jgi:DNA-binding transcriptional regulator YiaG